MPQTARYYVNWVNILLTIAAAGVIVVFLAGANTAWYAAETSDEIFRNFQIHREVRSVLEAMKDAETGQRGFLIMGDDRYLAWYHVGLSRVVEHLDALDGYAATGEVDPDRVAELRRIVGEKKAILEAAVAARMHAPESEAFLRAREIVATDRGKLLMDLIRSEIGEMLAARELEMERLKLLADGLANRHFLIISLGLLLTLSTFAAAAVFTNLERAERNRAGARLQTERSRLQAVIDASMDAVVAVDHEHRIVMLNPNAEDLFQRRERDATSQPFRILFPKRYLAELEPLMDVDAAGGPPRRNVSDGGIIQGLKADGTEFPAEAVVSRSLIDGRPLFTVILRDVTERETGRTRAREQMAILSRVRDAIHVRDLQGRIQSWNDGARELYGWDASEAVGRMGASLLQLPSDGDESGILSELLNSGVWIGERRINARDGRELTVESRRSLIVDDSGQPTSQLVIDIDITEEKRREQIERRSQRLESIGTLASGIAHDLNNVLTPITMGARLLRREPGEQQRLGLLDTITSSAERGAAMIRQLLSFAGGTSGPREVVDMKTLIEEASGILEHTLTQSVAVRTDVEQSLWPINGDPTELSQVLMNLAINARDAMPEGGTLTFEAHNTTLHESASAVGLSPGDYVCVSVSDTGTGIPPDVVDQIFDPFFTTKEQGRGTGLGLATCLGIIKSHNGNVSVYSEPRRGTKFTVYLPAQVRSAELQSRLQTESVPEGSGQTILLIDDEESILLVVRATLETRGYNVLTAVGGAAGIAAFRRRSAEIDLVIVDMMMPEIDGPETIRALRGLRPDVRIIASSGLKRPEYGGGVEGCCGFLSKPYDDKQLLNEIRNALQDMS
ncbi:MAG: PAS domain S-box protein [Planctomycetaceae bacterium]